MTRATVQKLTVTPHAAPARGYRVEALVCFNEPRIGNRTFAVSAVDGGAGFLSVTSVQATEGPRREVRRGKMRNLIGGVVIAAAEKAASAVAQ